MYEGGKMDNKGVVAEVSEICKKLRDNNCNQLPVGLNLLGYQHYNQGNILKAKEILLESKSILLGKEVTTDAKGLNSIYLGLVYLLEKDYDNAIHYFESGYRIYEHSNLNYGMADASSNLGLTYLESGSYELAEQYLTIAYDKSLEIEDHQVAGYSLLNLAKVAIKRGDYTKALALADDSYGVWNQLGHDKGKYYVHICYADIYEKNSNTNSQVYHLTQALELAKRLDVNIEQFELYKSLGWAYGKLGNEEEKVRNLTASLNRLRSINEDGVGEVISELIRIHGNNDEWQDIDTIFEHLQSLMASHDSHRQLEAESRIENEKSLNNKIIENQDLKQQQLKNEMKIRNRNFFLITLGALFVTILAITLSLFRERRNKRKRLETTEKHNQELQLKNQQIQDSKEIIEQQNISLEKKNKELVNFAYMASHDLKSPANTIKSFAGLLRRKVEHKLDKNEMELLDFIEKGGHNMYQLVTELLEYSKLEDKQLRLQSTDTKVLVRDLCIYLNQDIQSKNAEIEIGDLPKDVVMDPQLIRLVFQNLISNAIKFIPDGRTPKVSIHHQLERNMHTFYVKDNGIGIDAQYHHQVFNMFNRLNASDKFEGTGIGLATCEKLVHLHKGRIGLESIPNEGTTFYFTIPVIADI